MPEEESKVQVIIKDDIETGKVSCGHKICALKRMGALKRKGVSVGIF